MKRNYGVYLSLLLFSALLLSTPVVSRQAVMSSLSVCKNVVFPILFPFFVVAELLLSLGFTQWLEMIASPCMSRLFHLPGSAASAWILGCLGGYPVGAKTVASLYHNQSISREDAKQCLLFLNNAGPAFVIGVAGNQLLHSTITGLILWIIHLSASALIGILFRTPKTNNSVQAKIKISSSKFIPSITAAITKAGETCLQVCSFILFFSILSEQLSSAVPAVHHKAVWYCVLTGVIELTTGITQLSALSLSNEVRFVLAAFLLGWGGLCVHCQSISMLTGSNLQVSTYLAGKALHAILSLALACLIAPLLYVRPLTASSVVLYILPLLLTVTVILVLPKTTSGKLSTNHI